MRRLPSEPCATCQASPAGGAPFAASCPSPGERWMSDGSTSTGKAPESDGVTHRRRGALGPIHRASITEAAAIPACRSVLLLVHLGARWHPCRRGRTLQFGLDGTEVIPWGGRRAILVGHSYRRPWLATTSPSIRKPPLSRRYVPGFAAARSP